MNNSRRHLTPVPSAETNSRQYTVAERAQWIERYRRSGQNQRAFAAAHGLKLSQLRYWIYSPLARAEGLSSAPRLQEVDLSGWPSSHRWSAEVALPAGPTIRLDAALARELIAPLLAARS